MSDDLMAFLRARYEEEAQAASAASDGPWTAWRESRLRGLGGLQHVVMLPGQKPGARASIATASWLDAEHIARHDPARALREVEAKGLRLNAHSRPHVCIELTGSGERSVVDGRPWEFWEPQHTEDHGPCFVLRTDALPYADHPDYREEWRP